MFSRTAAILLAILGLYLSAVEAAAQPRGWGGGGHGGWGGGFHGGGFPGAGWGGRGAGGGPRGGGMRAGGGFGGGWGEPRMGRGYPGGFGGRMPGEGYPGEGPPGGGFPGRGPRGGFRNDSAPSLPFAGRGYTSPPVGGGAAQPSRAFGGGEGRAAFGGDWRAQQNEVRQAVREGRHIPLNQAIEAVRRRMPGRELDAGLEPGPDGRSVYRLRWAGQNGRRQDYLVDAGSGAIVGVQGGP